MCQIIPKIPKIPVHMSNYTKDTKDICSCVKLYLRYLFVCKIVQKLSVHVSNLK